MDWEDICKKNNVDSSFLKEFRPSAGLRLLNYGEFLAAKERLTSYQLGASEDEKKVLTAYVKDKTVTHSEVKRELEKLRG